MSVELYEHQQLAVDKLEPGFILDGGVGSGKSRTAIAYYYLKICNGRIKINGKGDTSPMIDPKDLYIITTAKKRDGLDWEKECAPFMIFKDPSLSVSGVKVTIDSWNNISKYTKVKNAFFIFDEQRLVGSGKWVKSFLSITKLNKWILLSATPGDTWSDYIPVFIANNFYKNRTEFLRIHAVYNRFSKYPKIEKYIVVSKLVKQKNQITLKMHYDKPTLSFDKHIFVDFDEELFNKVKEKRWNVFENKPVKAIGELYYLMRKVVNSHPSRLEAVKDVFIKHNKLIVFYNFDYELEILRKLKSVTTVAEWNGHKHQEIPNTNNWIYLVQYTAGAEGWNCIETDATLFYSQNYSYKIVIQSAGRIDRLNTKFIRLYYYHLTSKSFIDSAISKSLKQKKNFNLPKDVTF